MPSHNPLNCEGRMFAHGRSLKINLSHTFSQVISTWGGGVNQERRWCESHTTEGPAQESSQGVPGVEAQGFPRCNWAAATRSDGSRSEAPGGISKDVEIDREPDVLMIFWKKEKGIVANNTGQLWATSSRGTVLQGLTVNLTNSMTVLNRCGDGPGVWVRRSMKRIKAKTGC